MHRGMRVVGMSVSWPLAARGTRFLREYRRYLGRLPPRTCRQVGSTTWRAAGSTPSSSGHPRGRGATWRSRPIEHPLSIGTQFSSSADTLEG